VTERFIVTTDDVAQALGGVHMIVLADYNFWRDHYDELAEWCNDNGATVEGMTLNIPSTEVLTLFCLQWS